jgi:4-amino-4-deoxy-L-arabinose transferase-like glycosyltransferase
VSGGLQSGEITDSALSRDWPVSSYQATIIGLTLLAAWLRLWCLNTIPPGLWFDEAYNAMDAVWMREIGTWPVFLLGNNGREAMFSYLLALSTTLWGETIYVVRLVPALIGILSIPLMYRWALTIFKEETHPRWLALISTAGLVVSFWAILMNRSGYRANLLPLFVLLVSYFFWRGWQTNQIGYYFAAGIGLGLSQYTYLSARLLPLVFVLFVGGQSLFLWRDRNWLKQARLGLLVMGAMSILVTVPLLLFFAEHPEAFWGRASDVAVKLDWSGDGLAKLAAHFYEAGRVFVDGQDPNWRHHLLGQPVLDWFNTLGFCVGIFVALKGYRRPVNLFLIILLLVMWLPAPLSEPVFHTLRLSGMLPAYYALVGLGLISLAKWVRSRLSWQIPDYYAGMTVLVALILFSGGLSFYDYFYRWAKIPAVYQAYDGDVVDLAHYLADSDAEVNLIIPFYLYTHASVRYIFHDSFKESILMPEQLSVKLSQKEHIAIVIPAYPPDDKLPPAFVWLVKDKSGPETAYVSVVRRDTLLSGLKPEYVAAIEGRAGRVIARQYSVDTPPMLALFPQQLPQKKVAFAWADNLRLIGYEFTPASVAAGSPTFLYLAWQILGYTGLKERMFIQLLDSQANPVGQMEVEPISRKMYRWRKENLILEQQLLELQAKLRTGLYFVRLGFFDPKTDQRLPAYSSDTRPPSDELIVGPLYLSGDYIDPTEPQYPVRARLGDEFELLGFSLKPAPMENSTEVQLFWRSYASVETNYTVFLQLLDPNNQIIAQVDSQPLAGIYPTSRWQPGDIISEKFILPVNPDLLAGKNRLVTGMYDLDTGVRLPTYDSQDNLLPDGMIGLLNYD